MDQPYNPAFPMVADNTEALADFRRWSLDPDSLITYLEHNLKGEAWDAESGTWKQSTAKERIMNDKGAEVVSSLCRTAISPFSMLSNLTDNEIIDLCRYINVALVKTFFWNWREYDIKKENLDLLEKEIMNFVFTGLKRALNAGERESINTTTRRSENVGQPSPQSNGSLMPFPIPFSGGR